MAIHIHNTPSGVDEPALPRAGLLRSRGAPCRILSHGEMLALLDGEKPELSPEPLLGADVCPTAGQTSGALTPRAEAPICGTVAQILPESGSADLAQARHARRALYDALEHGTTLLAALGLPRLVGDGFVPIDPEAVGEALADAVALLDAIDPDPDLEPSLGAPENHEPTTVRVGDWQWRSLPPDQRRWAQGVDDGCEADVVDEPHDAGDDTEETLGWAANMRQVLLGPNTADGDLTAPERRGKGFVRCGPDDAEDGHDAEETYEDPFWLRGDQMPVGSDAHA